MSFRPIIPYSGHDGWTYLKDTLADQKAKHQLLSPTLTEIDLAAFEVDIGAADTVDKLLARPDMTRVALEAFGLGEERPTPGFLRSALSAETSDEAAFLDRFGDPRLLEMAKTFGYGDNLSTPAVAADGFGADIVARHRVASFEQSVGAAEPDLRRALAFERFASDLGAATAAGDVSDEDAWRRVIEHDAARSLLAGAFGLGPGFEIAPRDRQIAMLADGLAAETGLRTPLAFDSAERRDDLIKAFLDRSAFGSSSTRPSLAGSGVRAWTALEASLENQQAAFARGTRNDADLRYFAREIADIASAEDLVADERLLGVALEAFGLGDAKPTADFVRSVLESDPDDPDGAAGSLADPRWAELSRAFGFGDGRGAQTASFGFADEIAARRGVHAFEGAVAERDADLGRALTFDREVQALAEQGLSAREGWARALGHGTVGFVISRALDLPDGFAGLRADEQVSAVMEAAKALTGSDRIDALASDRVRETMLRDFFSARADEADARPNGLAQPLIPLPGLAGWNFLNSTLDQQQARFSASFEVRRELDYFRENIASIETAEQLVGDRRLLAVALESFGLAEEIDKGAFIRRALEEGTESGAALAMRLSDPRYREMAAAFGFGDGRGAQTGIDGFADMVAARYEVRAFETAVGQVDETMRLALNFDRRLAELGAQGLSEAAGWFRVLGDVPLRRVVEGAFGLPSQFAQVELESQLEVVSARTARLFGGDGSINGFADAETRADMISRFIVRSQIETGGIGAGPPGGLAALQLLGGGGAFGGSGLLNILA